MTLFRTVAPQAEPVTVAEVKAHLRLDHDSEDTLIAELLRTARGEVERATGCALIDQCWRLSLDDLPRSGRVLIQRHPVQEILAVTAYGTDGGATVIQPDAWLLDPTSRPARLHFDHRPGGLRAMNGVEIDFRAGFGPAGTDAPDPLRRAVLLLAAHWFEFRTALGPKDQPASYPGGYERLIAPWRNRRL